MRTLLWLPLLAPLLLFAAPSWACASCACGDPTLTSLGTEQPFAGRLRLSTELRYRTDTTGQPGVDALNLREGRWDLGVAWAPTPWLFLAVTLPLLERTVELADLSRDRTRGLGDAELRAKFYVWKNRAFAPEHLVSVLGGVKLPTGRVDLQTVNGQRLSTEAQPGTGSWDALFGGAYAFFGPRLSYFVSTTVLVPVQSQALRPGTSLRSSVAAQLQLIPTLATRLGLDTRLDSAATMNGVKDPHSGGFIAFLSPELLYSPVNDLTLYLQARVPTWNRLRGTHREGPFLGAGAAVDL